VAELYHRLLGLADGQGDIALDQFAFKAEADKGVLRAERLECLKPGDYIYEGLLGILALDHLQPVLRGHLHVPRCF